MSQGIITFAFGNHRKYHDLAKNLALTLIATNPEVKRCIITDSTDSALLSLYDDVIDYNSSYGNSVEQKVYLDLYTPYERTLFIDSDSLVVEDIGYIFDKFSLSDKPFSAMGDTYLTLSDEHPLFSVSKLISILHVERIPCFNGGVYYIDKNKEYKEFFKFSRSLIHRDDLFPNKFRGQGIADEAIYSASMAVNDYPVINFEDKGMFTTINIVGKVNVTDSGSVSFYKKNFVTQKVELKTPSIVHFPGNESDKLYYYKILSKVLGKKIKIPYLTCFINSDSIYSKVIRKIKKVIF